MGVQCQLYSYFILYNMNEKELFNFGDKELNVDSLLKNITSNQQSYLDYYSSSIPDHNLFIKNVNYIKEGIQNGSITTDGTGVYRDMNGKLSQNDPLMNNALHFVNVIATEQSKQTRSLTKSELAAKKAEETHKKEELERQKVEQEETQRNTKPAFTPSDGWSVATSFARSFNQNGQIPYNLLQQLVTTDSDGNPVYTDLYTQLDKNFDSVSKQLEQFSGTESYINNINLFKDALKDGDLSPQDRFLGMELGFQNSEMDKLNTLIKYKIEPQLPEPEPVVEEKEQETPQFVQNSLESDSEFKNRVDDARRADDYYTKVMKSVNFDNFRPAKKLKQDSEEKFKKELKNYIHNWVVSSRIPGLTVTQYYPGSMGFGSSYSIPVKDITIESLAYMDPKLYNELGLRYFSTYSTSNMYKHFKDLVDKQNKETAKKAKGGILKANNGAKTPWRLNFDGTTHKMEDIYNLFTENATSYDSKQLAEALNKLNSDDYKSLNFEGKDNTLGFKNWNVTFDESGLNNLFGYDESKADYLGVTTRSRNNFVTYLKDKGSINTGNGDLLWNSESNKWEYSNWIDKTPEEKAEVSNDTSTEATLKAPESTDLTLKDLNVKKPVDLNPDGIINSLAGYVTNAVANAKKRKIQQSIPIYQEVTPPEKAFKTAYTYDLEKAKGEIMAEAANLKPITSDTSVYYAAKNDAIKNARAYTTKLDTEINDRVHQIANDNQDIAFENAVSRTTNTNTNAKYRHEWDVEQKQGEVDYIEANNQSFQNLNKEIKHNIVTNARKKQKIRDAYMNKHMLTGLATTPSNYINGWTKHHDLIWYKGQNGLLTTDQEQVEYSQLQSIVNQASMHLLASYDGIKQPDMDTLYVGDSLKETYDPAKHGTVISAAKGAKIDKQKIHKFVNKLK